MCVELFRWLGSSLRPHIKGLRPTQLRELDTAFDMLPPDARSTVSPVRLIKKHQQNGSVITPTQTAAKPEKKQHTPLQASPRTTITYTPDKQQPSASMDDVTHGIYIQFYYPLANCRHVFHRAN